MDWEFEKLMHRQIFSYDGKPGHFVENMRCYACLCMLQDLIKSKSKLFEGFDNKTICIIDCATKLFKEDLYKFITD